MGLINNPGDMIWIANPPAGVVSYGPSVIYDLSILGSDPEESLRAYRDLGYKIIHARIERNERDENEHK